MNVDDAPLALTQLVAGFDGMKGFFHPPSKRVFSLQSGLASSLARVTVARIEGAKVTVTTLPVKGKVPTGRVEGMAYEPSIDRFVAIVRAQRPHRIEIVSIALGDAEATFDTLAQPAPPAPDGYMFNELYPMGGGGSLLAVRGNDLLTLTVSVATSQATWSAPRSASEFRRGNGGGVALDVSRGRLIGFGRDVFDPAAMKVKFEATVGTMPLSAGSWTELSLANPPPDPPSGPVSAPSWLAWDGAGERLFAVVPVEGTCGTFPCTMQSLWVANLSSGSWSKLRDHFNPPTMYAPFATDDAGRRVISHGGGILSTMSIDDVKPLDVPVLTQEGDLGPSFAAAAAVLTGGRVLSSDGGAFRVIDPAAAAPRWERFGKATLPQDLRHNPSFTEDPTTGEMLVFGGASTNATPASGAVWVLAKDGSTLTKESPDTGGPAGRTGHGAAMLGRTLVIAGGDPESDVWSFDRVKKTWRKLGALPSPLTNGVMRAASPTEAWVVGMSKQGDDYVTSPIVGIDVATGAARALPVHGESPPWLWSVAPLGSCFVGYESGTTVDGSQPRLWRCKKDGDGIRWESFPLDVDDYSIGGGSDLRGAAAPDGSRAYFVGRSVWTAAAAAKPTK